MVWSWFRQSPPVDESPRSRTRLGVEALEERDLLNAASFDIFFGDKGKVLTDFGMSATAAATVIEPDGQILVVGTAMGVDRSDVIVARYNPSGQLDTTFGDGGHVEFHIGTGVESSDQAKGILVESDGKILVLATYHGLGTLGSFAVARLNADGSLDNSFGTDGMVVTAPPPPSAFIGLEAEAAGFALQADGKIVVAGSATTTWTSDVAPPSGFVTRSQFAVTRLNADGSVDNNFGSSGWVTTAFGDTTSARAAALVIQADGKIVVAGTSENFLFPPVNGGIQPMFVIATSQFAVARYNADGSLDTGFGTGGKVATNFNHISMMTATGVALDSQGRIVVAGTDGGKIAVARFTTAGALDTSFGQSGEALVDLTGNQTSQAAGVVVTDGDRIVVAGSATSRVGNHSRLGMAGFTSTGSLDTSFGHLGRVITKISNQDATAAGIVVQADGKIVVAGTGVPHGAHGHSQFVLVRYDGASAQPTATSGIRGVARVGPISPVSRPHQPNSMPLANAVISIEPDGGGPEIAHVVTDSHGRFHLALPPGKYLLVPLPPQPGAIVPHATPQTIVITAGQILHVNIEYDSGIR